MADHDHSYWPWRAALDLADLIAEIPAGLEVYQPRLRYCLLDQGRMTEADLLPLRNLAAALFRLERSRGPGEVAQEVAGLAEWLNSPQDSSLRRAFVTWIKNVLPSKLPGVELPPVADLQEITPMLADTVLGWTRQWKESGRQEGLELGWEQGWQKGQEQGRERERQETLERLRGGLASAVGGALRRGVRGRARQSRHPYLGRGDRRADRACGHTPSLAALGLE